MKVLLLSREYPPHIYGGAGVVVEELSRALASRMAVEVRCFGPGQPPAPAIAVRGYAPWERLAGSGASLRFVPALEALSVNLAMARDAVDADVVHAHTWYADMAGFLIRTVYEIPLVVTLHSIEPLRPWKADQLGAGHRLSTWMEHIAIHSADRVVAVSAAMRADVLSVFGVDPSKVVVIHNGIDPERFRRTTRRDVLNRRGVASPYVLFVGRITEQKGIFQLLRAAPGFPAGVQLVLVAASADTPHLEARLRSTVRDMANILWIPEQLPVEEIVELYSHALAFVCPSIYEPFGLINLEAMACETPVVATTVGGIPEVVHDGTTGLLVPPDEPEALVAALRQLLENPERARTMGRAGRRRVESEFSWSAVAERTEQVYRDALREYRDRRR